MPRRRMNIRVIKEILRLKFGRNFSIRQISGSVNKGKSNIQRLIRKAEEAGLDCRGRGENAQNQPVKEEGGIIRCIT